MATSPHARCILGLDPVVLGVVISPEQKKPKKHRSAAAQIMIISGYVARGSKVGRMARRMAGVIGSLVWLGFDACSRWVLGYRPGQGADGVKRKMSVVLAGLE